MQIAVLRAEPPFQLQRHVFSVHVKDNVSLYPVVDQLHLDVPHVRAHLLDFLRRRGRAIGSTLRASGGRRIRRAIAGQCQVGGQVGIQLRFVHAQRRGLAVRDGFFHLFKFFFRSRSGLRAGLHQRWRRLMEQQNERDDGKRVGRPANNSEDALPRAGARFTDMGELILLRWG